MFIELTLSSGPVWLNVNLIEGFRAYEDGKTRIWVTSDSEGSFYTVYETPQEILAEIEEARAAMQRCTAV